MVGMVVMAALTLSRKSLWSSTRKLMSYVLCESIVSTRARARALARVLPAKSPYLLGRYPPRKRHDELIRVTKRQNLAPVALLSTL